MSNLPTTGQLMKVTRAQHDGAAMLQVEGEVDLNNADELERHILDVLGTLTAPEPLLLDLRKVSFFGSCGLALLVRCTGKATERGTPLRVIADQSAVQRPMEIVGLVETVPMHPSLDTALPSGEPTVE